jgi:hypothetical protein
VRLLRGIEMPTKQAFTMPMISSQTNRSPEPVSADVIVMLPLLGSASINMNSVVTTGSS